MKLWAKGIKDELKVYMSGEISKTEHAIESKIEAQYTQFGESIAGTRRYAESVSGEVRDVEMKMEREFVKKDELTEFQREYREDQRLQVQMLRGIQSTVDQLVGRSSVQSKAG